MKKWMGSFLIAILIIGLAGVSFATEDESTKASLNSLENKLAKIKAYLSTLDIKMNEALEKREWKKATMIKNLIAKESKRVPLIKKQIAELQEKLAEQPVKKIEPERQEKAAAKPSAPAQPAKKRGIVIEGGRVGGGTTLMVNYVRPLNPNLNLKIGLGYGIGDGYNLSLVRAVGVFKIDNRFFDSIGLSIDYGNYSEKVEDVNGLVGSLAKGGNTGAGLSFGKMIGPWKLEAGYSSALWPIITIGYEF